MTRNLDQYGLKSIVDNYDLFFIDIWGVIHNGIKLNSKAVKVLDNLTKKKKEFVLLTNAPRPNITVIDFLKNIGLKNYYKNIFTSGEAALKYLTKELKNKTFFHIGPPRDFDLFKNFKKFRVLNIEKSDYLLCSGLFEEHENDEIYYKKIFKNQKLKKMICTNPDLIVDRGNKRELCAGSVAKYFEEIGGEVVYFGKPYPPVYKLSANLEGKKILCIGDNLNTDIKGANVQKFDSLLISSGIHRKEILNMQFEDLHKHYNVKVNYMQTNLQW